MGGNGKNFGNGTGMGIKSEASCGMGMNELMGMLQAIPTHL